jgi:putative FmdB family regulatory protein
MPTYDYVCRACGHRIEVHHGLYAEGPTQCPNCHSHALRKAIAAPAIVFKGSGWAKKDRRPGSATKTAAPDGSGGDAGHPSSSGSSESPSGKSESLSGSSESPSGSSESPKGGGGATEPPGPSTATEGTSPSPGVD